MAGDWATVWELEPHTAAKHVILRKYLNAWLPKLTKSNSRVVIINGLPVRDLTLDEQRDLNWIFSIRVCLICSVTLIGDYTYDF